MPNPMMANWLNSMTWQADFYGRSGHARRKDPEFEWGPLMRSPAGRFPETKRFRQGHPAQAQAGPGLRPLDPVAARTRG